MPLGLAEGGNDKGRLATGVADLCRHGLCRLEAHFVTPPMLRAARQDLVGFEMAALGVGTGSIGSGLGE